MERNAYMHDWQEQVIGQLASLNKASQDTAVVLERINGRLDNFDQRLKTQENNPTDLRQSLTGYGGCLASAAFAVVSLASLVISLITIISQHWH